MNMVKLLKKEDFDPVFHLMETSFPKNEHRTYEEQKALLDNPLYQIYILQNDIDGMVIGFMAVWEFDAMTFIEHFAVSPFHRNGGIGSRFLKEVMDRQEKMICLEVEPPENELASRRVQFYERNGFFLNEYPYQQPSITKGQNAIPLMIMTSGRPISRDEFAALKKLLYARVYKQVSIKKASSK